MMILPAGILIRHWRSEPSLLQRATRIANVQDWEHLFAYSPRSDFTYRWLSNTELMMARRSGSQLTFYRRSVAAGQEIPLRALSKLFNILATSQLDKVVQPNPGLSRIFGMAARPMIQYGNMVQLSPDGKWLLWEGRSKGRYYRFCALLDGSRLLKWPWDGSDISFCITWLSDSKRWVEEVSTEPGNHYGLRFRVCSVSEPESVQNLPVYRDGLHGHHIFLATTFLSTVTIPVVDGVPVDKQIERMGLQAQLVPLNREPGSMNRDTFLPDRVSVNQHNRVARIIDSDRNRHQSVIVSNPDGTRRTDVGGISTRELTDNTPQLSELHWLPDGKRLSFLYNKALYIVPAD